MVDRRSHRRERRRDVDKVEPVERGTRDKTLIEVAKTEKVMAKLLIARNMPKQILVGKSFTLDEAVTRFTSEVDGLKPKKITKEKQLAFLKKVFDNPFYAPYIMCLSSNPNDLRAKQLAAYIMALAIKAQPNIKRLAQRELPYWHVMTGGFNNPLINTPSKASMLIISNVPKNSTNVKFENLRDILETYNNIPRIVITTGTDPVTLFNEQLHMHLNLCAQLSNPIVKRVSEL